jgi:membrane-associated phospholipid phosphatase
MPPLYQDALSAAHGLEGRWIAVLRAALDVACEGWVLALLGLALYSFLERDVKGVLRAFAPLAIAIALASGVAAAARTLGAVPRPLEAAGHALAPLLHRAFPTGQTAAVAAFVTYTALAYGRRASPAVLAGVALALARLVHRPHWVLDLAAGGLAGAAIAAAIYAAALRLAPGGHLARLRALRNGAAAPPEPGSP